MKDQEVPEAMQKRVLDYHSYLWARNKGQNIKELISDAPYTLQDELMLITSFDMLISVCVAFQVIAISFKARCSCWHVVL